LNRKAARGQATRQGIVETATRLFAEHGYANVAIEAVLAETGLSRGALYHHFAGKEALFEAVVEAVETDLCAKVIARSAGARDAIRAVSAGGEAFLDLAQEPAVRQIILVDAPSVLGWAKWREIEARYGFGLLKASLARAAAEGALAPEKVDIFAHILLASLSEVALMVARAPNREAAAAEAKAAMAMLIASIVGGGAARREPP
jgi:AcrR family transcriptional regulator